MQWSGPARCTLESTRIPRPQLGYVPARAKEKAGFLLARSEPILLLLLLLPEVEAKSVAANPHVPRKCLCRAKQFTYHLGGEEEKDVEKLSLTNSV